MIADFPAAYEDMASSCETAGIFYSFHALPAIVKYEAKLAALADKSGDDAASVRMIEEEFPLKKFFANAPQPLFKGKSVDEDLEVAKGCLVYARNVFECLEKYRPFEILHRVSVME